MYIMKPLEKTLGKMVTYELAYTVFDTAIGGIGDASKTNLREAWRRLNPKITIPIFTY